MARPLRILLPNCWYHVVNRGSRRDDIFQTDTDRKRFLGLVAELPERFGIQIAAFVLMDNHYHLVVQTSDPNLSDAIRWLQVSYSIRFNWANGLCGHVFQGRFRAMVLQGESDVVEVARYVHLNPVRITGLGLGKREQRAAKVVGCADPGAELICRRLTALEEFPWSSWRVYSGAETNPGWLTLEPVASGCGGRSRMERRAALRNYTEEPVRQGHMSSPWERLRGGLIVGDEEYADRILRGVPMNPEEQTEARRLKKRQSWEEIVAAAEKARRMSWSEILEKHRDWTRDGVLYYAVRHGRLRLVDVVKRVKGMKYQTGAQAVKRFRQAMEAEGRTEQKDFVEKLRRKLG